MNKANQKKKTLLEDAHTPETQRYRADAFRKMTPSLLDERWQTRLT